MRYKDSEFELVENETKDERLTSSEAGEEKNESKESGHFIAR
jgi:hypothetical protein